MYMQYQYGRAVANIDIFIAYCAFVAILRIHFSASLRVLSLRARAN